MYKINNFVSWLNLNIAFTYNLKQYFLQMETIHESDYQNESFWTYRDSDNVIQVKPAGTKSNDTMYYNAGNPIQDYNDVDIKIQKALRTKMNIANDVMGEELKSWI